MYLCSNEDFELVSHGNSSKLLCSFDKASVPERQAKEKHTYMPLKCRLGLKDTYIGSLMPVKKYSCFSMDQNEH